LLVERINRCHVWARANDVLVIHVQHGKKRALRLSLVLLLERVWAAGLKLEEGDRVYTQDNGDAFLPYRFLKSYLKQHV